jgi:UDP-N-acetylglucosamine 2-epimerase (non-hydrolysing)
VTGFVAQKMCIVAGARPNFMKIAPVIRAASARGHRPILVHTGQHYDDRMSDAFFRDLDLPDPDYHLGVGSGTHAEQTARVMLAFEGVVRETRPDWVVVVGDVNSTLACALVGVKLKEELGLGIAHVEAGLRSGDWRMPEEINRVLTDRVSDLLLTPSRDARGNLEAEGIPPDRIRFVGNVMIDTLLNQLPRARAADEPGRMGLERGGFAVATLHRPSNVDREEDLVVALEGLRAVASDMPLVLPLHPRTGKQVERFGLEAALEGIRIVPPLGYRQMVSLIEAAAVVLTDSGGLQEGTTALGVPCVTLREQTERPITLAEGTNRLAPWPLTREGIVETASQARQSGRRSPGSGPEGWDGHAAERVIEALEAARPLRGGD